MGTLQRTCKDMRNLGMQPGWRTSCRVDSSSFLALKAVASIPQPTHSWLKAAVLVAHLQQRGRQLLPFHFWLQLLRRQRRRSLPRRVPLLLLLLLLGRCHCQSATIHTALCRCRALRKLRFTAAAPPAGRAAAVHFTILLLLLRRARWRQQVRRCFL